MKAITKKLETKTAQHFDRGLNATIEAFEKQHEFISATIFMAPTTYYHFLTRFIGLEVPFIIYRRGLALKLEVNEEIYTVNEDECLEENTVRIQVDHKKKVIKTANILLKKLIVELDETKDIKKYESLTFNELEVCADTLEYYLCNPRRGVGRMGLPSALRALNALIKITESKVSIHSDWLILNYRLEKILSTYPEQFNKHLR